LSPLSDAHGKHRRFSAQPSDCDDGGAGVLPSGLHDVYSFTRVLPSAPAQKSRAADRGETKARLLWRLLPAGRACDPPAVGGARDLARFSRRQLFSGNETEKPVFS